MKSPEDSAYNFYVILGGPLSLWNDRRPSSGIVYIGNDVSMGQQMGE